MSSVVFIVWRESVEALLIIAILYSWLEHRSDAARGRRHLWLGVAGGLLAAALLAFAMQQISDDASAEALDNLQTFIVLAAACLLTYTVLWLQRSGINIKQQLQQQLGDARTRAGLWGVSLVSGLAVAREGAETVLFLYGFAAASGMASVVPGAMLGLLLAALSYALLRGAGRWLSWPIFFRVSTAVLLLLAGALFVDGSERLITLGQLPALVDPLFDVSELLDDGSGIGQTLAGFAGYRARPALTSVLVLAGYWSFVALLSRPRKRT